MHIPSALSSPVVLDASLSDEKLAELLAHRAEYPELDYKQLIDPTTTEGLVELALDLGAMQVRGAYIVAGVDGQGRLTGAMDGVDPRPFDEANLTPKLLRYLPEPLALSTRVVEREGHLVVMIYVARHPSGCAIFHADGQYEKDGELVVRFRAGDVFWRHGTRSERINQQGFEEIVARRIANAKAEWLSEQQEIRRQEAAQRRAELEEAQHAAVGPLGTVSLDLESGALASAVVELAAQRKEVAIRHVFLEAGERSRSAIERDEIETELADVVDKLACIGAALLRYQLGDVFERVVAVLAEIFSEGFRGEGPERFGYATSIAREEVGPRVWLLVIERVYALGALAVRQRDWQMVPLLALQRPEPVSDYYGNWLRWTIVMASRAQHLQARDQGLTEVNLLSRVRALVEEAACLRPDRVDGEAVLTSLARFDLLSNLAAIGAAGTDDDRVFYTNFAQFRQDRVQPIADQLLVDSELRAAVFPHDDEALAGAFMAVEDLGSRVGARFDGFYGWRHTPVGDFLSHHAGE